MTIKKVGQALADLGNIYAQRNALYKDNYKHFGDVMVALFPTGVELITRDDHNRFALFVQAQVKLTRYAQQFAEGGHPDSLDDACVYQQMLQEVDAEIKAVPAPMPQMYICHCNLSGEVHLFSDKGKTCEVCEGAMPLDTKASAQAIEYLQRALNDAQQQLMIKRKIKGE